MTQTKKLFFLILCLAVGQALIAQTTYNSVQNGDWNVATTWDANGIPPNPIPAGDVVNLNHRVTVPFSTTVTNNGSVLVPLQGTPVNPSTAAGLTVRGTFNNNNDLTVGPYTATVTNFVISVSGNMNNAGNIIVNAPATGPNGRTRYGGKINNLPGGLLESFDILQLGTEVKNAQGATIRLASGGFTFLQGGMFGGTFTNDGLFEIEGGSFNFRNGGTLDNNATGVVNNSGRLSVGFYGGAINNLGTINNLTPASTLSATPFSGVGVINSTNGTIKNDGVIYETDAGQLNFSASTLSGSGGVFGGRFVFSLPSGNTQPGTTTINGPLINSGKVIVKINGTTAGNFSVIEVLGVANLTGTTLEGFKGFGYSPTLGDEFEILTATGGVTGTFVGTDLTDIGPNLDWEVVYEANRVLLKVVDASNCTPTDITCPSNITVGNDNGDCGAIVTFTVPDGATATPPSGSFFSMGTTTVNVSGSDGCDGTSTCSFTVTVNDTEKPSITCPSNTTVGTDDDECGADVHLPAPDADDNCAVTQLKGRYRLVDANDNPLGSYTSRMNDPSDYLVVGRYQINWRAKDAANNKRSCSYFVEVVDDEDPTAVCKDVTVDFNGEASIELSPSQVWNEAASDDNCGVVHYVGTSPSLSISCDDLGSVIPLTVTIRDDEGNTDNCTADVTVTGLPCGWSEGDDDGSLNCAGNTAVDYDVDDESFSMSSDGCWQGSHDPDKATYVYQELCGDGTLTARLASINTAGYAGLMLRETLDPESRRAGAVKDFSTRRVRREYRSTYGGSVTRIHSNRSRVEWFRIVRKGNEIKSYTSTNGSYWRLLYRVVMPNLEDCVYIGMMAYSKNSSSDVEAVFDNVSFSGSGSSLIDNNNSLPNSFTAFDTELEIEQPDVNIFPNPSNGQSQIELNGFQEAPAQIIVRDAFGKVVRQIELDNPEGAMLPLELQDMPAGLYLISVMQDQQQVITKKLMIQR